VKLKNLFKRSSALLAMAMVAVAVAVVPGFGCNRGGGANAPKKLAFVTNNSSEFWKIAKNGIKKYEAEGKIQVDVKEPPTGTVAEQNQILESLLAQGYDAIAVSVLSPRDQTELLNKVAGKTKLITFDSDAEKSNRLLYIGTINYEAGKKLGEQIVKLLPNGGRIAVFVGTFSADNAAQRLKGIEDAIAGKNIEIVEKKEDNKNEAMARSNAEAILNNDALKVDCLVGLWAYNGSAIAAAIEGSNKKGKIKAAVFDEDEGTLRGIENSLIDCTVVQHPFEMGYRSAKWMHKLTTDANAAASIPADKIDNTGIEVIEKSNVADFRARLAEWKK
jgi:ribose transport system substrate-binding protein